MKFRYIIGIFVFPALYVLQISIVELRILIPEIDVVDDDIRYKYCYGISDYQGFDPFFGILALTGDGTRVKIYEKYGDAQWNFKETVDLDLFNDFKLYKKHKEISLNRAKK